MTMRAMVLNPESFFKVMEFMLTTHDIDEMLHNVTEEVRDLIDAKWCTLYILDDASNTLYTKVCQTCVIDARLPVDKTSLEGWAALTGREVVVNNVYNEREIKEIDPNLAFNPLLDEQCGVRTKNALCIPIKSKDRIIGVFAAFNKPGGFIDTSIEAAREFAFLFGIALSNAMLFTELKKTREELNVCMLGAAA